MQPDELSISSYIKLRCKKHLPFVPHPKNHKKAEHRRKWGKMKMYMGYSPDTPTIPTAYKVKGEKRWRRSIGICDEVTPLPFKTFTDFEAGLENHARRSRHTNKERYLNGIHDPTRDLKLNKWTNSRLPHIISLFVNQSSYVNKFDIDIRILTDVDNIYIVGAMDKLGFDTPSFSMVTAARITGSLKKFMFRGHTNYIDTGSLRIDHLRIPCERGKNLKRVDLNNQTNVVGIGKVLENIGPDIRFHDLSTSVV